MLSQAALTPGLYRVRDINWADPTIIRAGIIPINYNGNYRWMEFGVSQYAATITAIGGAHEEQDHDLLATAIREYNEEVGSNMRHIVAESVINCYAIKTAYTIQILLPMNSRTSEIIPT